MAERHERRPPTHFGDQEYTLVQFLLDSRVEVVKSRYVRISDDGIPSALWEADNKYYMCTIHSKSYNKEELLRKAEALRKINNAKTHSQKSQKQNSKEKSHQNHQEERKKKEKELNKDEREKKRKERKELQEANLKRCNQVMETILRQGQGDTIQTSINNPTLTQKFPTSKQTSKTTSIHTSTSTTKPKLTAPKSTTTPKSLSTPKSPSTPKQTSNNSKSTSSSNPKPPSKPTSTPTTTSKPTSSTKTTSTSKLTSSSKPTNTPKQIHISKQTVPPKSMYEYMQTSTPKPIKTSSKTTSTHKQFTKTCTPKESFTSKLCNSKPFFKNQKPADSKRKETTMHVSSPPVAKKKCKLNFLSMEPSTGLQCSSCATLKVKVKRLEGELKNAHDENDELKSKLSGHATAFDETQPPRPGRINRSKADYFKMVELMPGCQVYLYEHQLTVAEKKLKRNGGTCCALHLLRIFFKHEELIGANLTGANDKKALDKNIIDAIVGYAMQASSHGDQASMANIKRSLRSRLSTINSKVKEASKRRKKNTNSVPTIDDPDVSDGSNISDKDVVMVTDNENEEEVDNSIWDGNGQDDDEEMDFLNDTDDVDDEKD